MSNWLIEIKSMALSHRRQLISLAAVFLAAIFWGYVGERHSAHTSDQVNRLQLLHEFSAVISRLKPVLTVITPKKGLENQMSGVPKEVVLPLQLGLMKCFPDGGWHLNRPVNRGEAVAYFSLLIDFLKDSLLYPQAIEKVDSRFEDVGTGHWLERDLNKLAGIGATSCFEGLKFNPEKTIEVDEIRKIGQGISDYFSSNMLILKKSEEQIEIVAKGSLKKLDLDEFEASWDGENWCKLPESAQILLQSNENLLLNIHFRHATFLQVGPVEIPRIGAATVFVKLRRNYQTFVKTKLEEFSNKRSVIDESEMVRIRERLAQLKKRNLQNDHQMIAKDSNNPELENKAQLQFSKPDRADRSTAVEKRIETVKNLPGHDNETKSVQVSGKITDAIDGKPLEGALLVCDGKSQQITADGTFSISAFKHQVIEFTVYCEGYSPLQMKHRVGYRAGSLKLRLKPEMAVFSGIARCADTNLPINQAVIKLGDKTTRTASDGSFQLKGIRPGYHQISCFARNYLEAHEIVFVAVSQTRPYDFEVKRESFEEELENSIAQENQADYEQYQANSVDFAD